MSGKKFEWCPFCDGDDFGCCFCEHTGKIPVKVFKILTSSQIHEKVKTGKESDLRELYDKGVFNHI